jgi:hypothetical protein
VAAQLGIADLLREGPRSVQELAGATDTDAETLYRLLRALASVGVFDEDSERRFGLTGMGEYLRCDHPLTVNPFAQMFGADYEWRAWGELLHSVRTGENAAQHALGMDVWEYRRRHPDDGAIFDAAMRTSSSADSAGLLAAYDFSRHSMVADIAGGTGALLAAILTASPGTRGILFDQPHVVANAGSVLEQAGVADRVQVVPGSFFESVPSEADAYILRRILHDWMDPEAAAILTCIRRSMGPDARLLIIDAVVGPPNADPLTKFLDLMMLVSAGGRERTEDEWRRLFAATGFGFEGATPATPSSHIIEASPE